MISFYEELKKISPRLAEHILKAGFWFTSCPEFVEIAKQAVLAGLLVSVEDVLKNDNIAVWERGKAFYVPYTVQRAFALPHSVYRHTALCVPCQGQAV